MSKKINVAKVTKNLKKKNKRTSIKSIRKWWSKQKGKPITWGNYAKMCKWSLGFVGAFYLGIFIWFKVSEWRQQKKAFEDTIDSDSGRYSYGNGDRS